MMGPHHDHQSDIVKHGPLHELFDYLHAGPNRERGSLADSADLLRIGEPLVSFFCLFYDLVRSQPIDNHVDECLYQLLII